MILPPRLLHAMIDPKARCGDHHLCAIDATAASFRRGDGRSGARRPGISNQDRSAAGPRPSTAASLRPRTPVPTPPIPHRTT